MIEIRNDVGIPIGKKIQLINQMTQERARNKGAGGLAIADD